MEISKLINQITSFIKILHNESTSVKNLLKTLEKDVDTVREQLEVLSITRDVTLPADVLKRYPDIKCRVITNLSSFVDEEICEIKHLLKQLNKVSTELRKIYQKIEKCMTQVDWGENSNYLTAFTDIVEWADASWKYFYYVHLNINNGIRVLNTDNTFSSEWLKNSFTFDNVNVDYVFSNPLMDLFQVLKTDVVSRNKIKINNFKSSSKNL